MKPRKAREPASSPERLTETGKKGSVELTERELKKVSGGGSGEELPKETR